MKKPKDSRHSWEDDYQSLNLCNGSIKFISEDDEDMIEISYPDGMLIDVGKPASARHYCITVVSSDDANAWAKPVEEVTVSDRQDLAQRIQDTIFKYRNR